MQFPSAGSKSSSSAYITEPVIHWLSIALIFFFSGLSLSTRALRHQAANVRLHIATLLIEFLAFPALVFGLICAVRAAQGTTAEDNGTIESWLLPGFMFMAVAPTTVGSNVVMTRLAGGNVGKLRELL